LRPVPPADWLRPEFAVLQQRFREWERELATLRGDAVLPVLHEPLCQVRHIAERIRGELQRFQAADGPAAEPEDLRRLLSHGRQLTEQLATRISGLEEVRRISRCLAGACGRLLHEPTVDGGSVCRLWEWLQPNAGKGNSWVLSDPALREILVEAADSVGENHRSAMMRVLQIGVPASRLAARVARRLGLANREMTAALYASLFQNCGYLLLRGRQGYESSRHPHYGAALAAGLRGIPTEALVAIAGHHPELSEGNFGRTRRPVDCVVAVASRYVENCLRPESPPLVPKLELGNENGTGGYQSDVVAALKAELARAIVLQHEPPGSDSHPASTAQSGGFVPAPRFLRPHSRSPERVSPVL
jgi:hypothetical protein